MHGNPDTAPTDEGPASSPPGWPAPGTPPAEEEPTIELPVVTQAMFAADPPAAHTVTGALAGRTEAGFDVVDGAERVTLRTAGLGADLYRVTTPEGGAAVRRRFVRHRPRQRPGPRG